MTTHQYETLYGVGLLDDLHNYFPAVLYQPNSFHSVADLLQYVQLQTRNRFDLFSLGQREYRSRVPSPPPPASVNVSSSDVPVNGLSANSTLSAGSPVTPPHNATVYTNVPPPLYRGRNTVARHPYTSLEYMFNIPDFEDDAVNAATTTRLLQTLLTFPLGPNARGAGMDAFLQPVTVRPTPEQIAANTTVGNLVSDEEHTCAICQDTLLPEQEGRKLNHCGHWFHKSCIDTWFDTNVHCPVCRQDIREQAAQEED